MGRRRAAGLLWFTVAAGAAPWHPYVAAADLGDGTPVVCHAARSASGATRFARVRDHAVADPLAAGHVDVIRPDALCAPAGLVGRPAEPDLHWERYRVRPRDRVATSLSPSGLHVVTADEAFVLDVQRPAGLLAPTAVTANAPVTPPAGIHPTFQCYAADVIATTHQPGPVTLDTGAGPTSYLLRRPTRLCLGTGNAAGGPHLLCFAVAARGSAPIMSGLHTQSLFGPERLDRRALREVCLPALVDAATSATTTTTTTPATVPTTTSTTHPPVGGVLPVPSVWPTIQTAVDVAAPGASIRIAPGTYRESVFISGAKHGLTIEAADPLHPPEIVGVVGSKLDGIRADFVDGLTIRNLRIVDAYDAIRLNHCAGALLERLHLENSALGVRMNDGGSHTLRDSIVAGTRVEQGIWIEYAPDTVLERLRITNGAFGGLRVRNADRVRLTDVDVAGSNGSDGIKVEYSRGARVERCQARQGYARGFRVTSSPGLIFAGNVATDNAGAGIRIESSTPFATAADVLAAGNTAAGNAPDVSVQP